MRKTNVAIPGDNITGPVYWILIVYNLPGGLFRHDEKARWEIWLTISGHIVSSINLELQDNENRLF